MARTLTSAFRRASKRVPNFACVGMVDLDLAAGPKGDLIATIHIGGHPWFTRQGLDLMVNVPITIAEAISGAKVRVSLLKGSVDVQIPPGSSSGTRLRIRGQGIQPDAGVAGDLFAIVQIVVPRDVPSVVRDAIEPVSAALPDPRIDAPGVETANSASDPEADT